MYKILKNIIAASTVIVAIIYLVYSIFNSSVDMYEGMILSLLILIATTTILEGLDEERKWKDVKRTLKEDISNIADCQIQVFSSASEWVLAMEEIIKEGHHTIDTASLDSGTRSKPQGQHSKVWQHINRCCSNEKIKFRHIIRVRANNLNNLLDRILSGSASKDSYFAFFQLDEKFSFPTFGIIDNRYLSTRSPYQAGETPAYYIIENEKLVSHYSRYFSDLWVNSKKIESVTILKEFMKQFEDLYSEEMKKTLNKKIEKIQQEGIIDDI